MNHNLFESKIKPILNYVGAIGATILSVAYIIIVIVLIQGFKAEKLMQTTVFGLVNAGVGFIIMQFLKVQGISFAKMIPENAEIEKQYHRTKTKDKKAHSIKYYWVKSVAKDICTKCFSIGATTIGLIYIVIEGSNDYNMLLLALTNLLMFICFGLLALSNAYDFYNNQYVSYMKEKLNEREIEESVDMTTEKCTEQRNDTLGTDSGDDILEPVCRDCIIGDYD